MSIDKEFFTLVVIGSDSKPVSMKEPQVYSMKDGEEYRLHILNHHSTKRANAKIFIDGKEVLHVRINNCSSIVVDRPAHVQSKFTFVKSKSGISTNPHKGILEIRFALEEESCLLESDDVTDGPSRGETVFGNKSTQKFKLAEAMKASHCTTIKALMVVSE